jgi:hypothetical protein
MNWIKQSRMQHDGYERLNVISLQTQGILKTSLGQNGLRKTWVDLLSAHVLASGDNFHYILDDSEFNDFNPDTVDILSGLTVGEIGLFYEFSLAYVDMGSRADQGQYFTPDDVAQFMVSHAKEFTDGVWLDPCSGVGNLSYWLVKSQKDPEKFLRESLILVDRDPLALLIASVIMTTHFQTASTDVFHALRERSVCRDYLDDTPLPAHDFTLMNPPYVGVSQDTRFESFKAGDLYAYFLEKAIKHSSGVIAITPQSFLNAAKFEGLRNTLIGHGLKIYSFDNVPDTIFKGFKFGSQNTNTSNSTRASITVMDKKSSNTAITPLLRWRAAERSSMFDAAAKMLTDFNPDKSIFPKCGSDLKPLFDVLSAKPSLKTLLSSTPTEWMLTIPSSPRYFTPAVKRNLSRSSAKTIYFKDENSLKKAYILLNSSVFYWWWRVMDGGMTVSLKTIQTLPIPDFKVDESLISLLEASEQNNLVVKMNAGKPNENVKHPVSLVTALNAVVAPDYVDALMETHSNSFIAAKAV